MIRPFYLCILSFLMFSCDPNEDPQAIIDAAIKTHGGGKFEALTVEFDFRKKHFTVARENGTTIYTREFPHDSLGSIKDVLTNRTDFERYANDTLLDISQEWQGRYGRSVNSVLYFFQLPYGLNDPAVYKKYLGKKILNGKMYDKIKITFAQEGGGDDFEDVFIYWISEVDKTLDYLAYSYTTDGGGTRFRQAVNRRKIEGMVFQDYINFKAAAKDLPIEKHDDYFVEGLLIELSIIANENIRISSN